MAARTAYMSFPANKTGMLSEGSVILGFLYFSLALSSVASEGVPLKPRSAATMQVRS
jgi:hypothetical protein